MSYVNKFNRFKRFKRFKKFKKFNRFKVEKPLLNYSYNNQK